MSVGNEIIFLGNEFDDELRRVLVAVLERNGAVLVDEFWGVGGSQEVERMLFRIGSDVITIEAETYVGLTICGPKLVVADIAQQVRVWH
ncbi:hypothetical protein ABE485_24350 [Achromobacter spanius]|uniref:hypothetical protein n=1 Tax=Achromobacter spanius TaxID=217203 RepID=UPI00320A3A0A